MDLQSYRQQVFQKHKPNYRRMILSLTCNLEEAYTNFSTKGFDGTRKQASEIIDQLCELRSMFSHPPQRMRTELKAELANLMNVIDQLYQFVWEARKQCQS